MELKTRNVNTAFRKLVGYFYHGCEEGLSGPTPVKKSSRNGNVMMIEEPVTITYSHPRERVLFNEARDANPHFHLYEGLWMLAGRNDVGSVAYYAKNMLDFSDDGKTLNGAYGYRWRTVQTPGEQDESMYPAEISRLAWHGQHGGIDQLDIIVAHLKNDPNSRRAVLQMWNVEDDLLKIGLMKHIELRDANDPTYRGEMLTGNPGSKDVCCNLSVMFSLRETEGMEHLDFGDTYTLKCRYLDITVTNRSNDLVWGLLGANYVHFTMLQEYMAAQLGVAVGKYHHFSNNLHCYEWNWKPEEWLADSLADGENFYRCATTGITPVPLVKDPETFDKEVVEFVQRHSKDAMATRYQEPFLNDVAQPLCVAYHHYKRKQYENALAAVQSCKADDWRLAATNWLKRRMK